jgi:hypothetical protein
MITVTGAARQTSERTYKKKDGTSAKIYSIAILGDKDISSDIVEVTSQTFADTVEGANVTVNCRIQEAKFGDKPYKLVEIVN